MARVRLGVGVRAVLASGCVLLLPATPAFAAPKRITGKLDKPGYTVIALATDGEATTDQTQRGRFALRPPAKSATLHLRAHDGTYAGPVVTGRDGERAIMGVRAGTELGKIEVKPGRGYAKVSRRLSEEELAPTLVARARNGVPIGAGVFGRVRSKRAHGGVPGDTDLDGIPDPLDVDDDGDRILDNLDVSAATGSAQVAEAGGCGFYCPTVSSYLAQGSFEQTVNVNAGSTAEQVDAVLSSIGYLRFSP